MTRTLVIGIGNPLLGPEAFGPAVVDRLRARPDVPATVELLDAHTDLLASLDRFLDAEHVVLVDAFLGAGTGAVVVVDEPTFTGWSTESPGSHALSAAMAVRLFRTLTPSATVRLTLVGLDIDHVGGEPLSPHVVETGADAVLGVCGA